MLLRRERDTRDESTLVLTRSGASSLRCLWQCFCSSGGITCGSRGHQPWSSTRNRELPGVRCMEL